MYKYYSSCKLVHGCKQDSLLRNTRHKTARCISMCILTKICSLDCEVNPLIRRACSKPFRGIEYRSEGSHISPVTLALLFCSAILRLAVSIKTAIPGTNSVFYKKKTLNSITSDFSNKKKMCIFNWCLVLAWMLPAPVVGHCWLLCLVVGFEVCASECFCFFGLGSSSSSFSDDAWLVSTSSVMRCCKSCLLSVMKVQYIA